MRALSRLRTWVGKLSCTTLLGCDFFIVVFRSAKVRLVNAAFAEQKATTFCASRIKSWSIRVVIPTTRSIVQLRAFPKIKARQTTGASPFGLKKLIGGQAEIGWRNAPTCTLASSDSTLLGTCRRMLSNRLVRRIHPKCRRGSTNLTADRLALGSSRAAV